MDTRIWTTRLDAEDTAEDINETTSTEDLTMERNWLRFLFAGPPQGADLVLFRLTERRSEAPGTRTARGRYL